MDDHHKTREQLIAELTRLRERVATLERAEAERQQEDAKIRFQAQLLNVVEQAVIVTLPDGEITFWNPFAETLYGWPADAAIGRNILDVTVPRMSQIQDSDIMHSVVAGQAWSGEFIVQHRDGTTFPASVTVTPVMDAQGNLVAIISVYNDITERKRYETELQGNQRFLEHIADTIPNQLYVFDLVAGHNVYINDKVEAFSGLTLEELQARGATHFLDVLHPDDRTRLDIFSIQWDQAEDEQVFEKEYRLRNADGEYRWIRSYERVFNRNAEGVPIQIVGSAMDITESKWSQEQLRVSEKKFSALTNLAPVGIYLTNVDGDCTYANPCWLDMAGMTLDEVLGHGWINGIHPDDRVMIQTTWNETVKHRDVWNLDYRFCTSTGKVTWVHAVAVPVFDADHNFSGYIGTNLDITDRKLAEEQAAKANLLLENTGRIAKIGGWELDLPTMHPYFSAEASRIHDLPPGKAPGLERGLDFYAPNSRPIIAKAVKDAIEENIPYDLELPFITAKGRHIWVRTQGRVHFEDGQAARLYGSIQDITDRKLAEAELQATKDFYLAIIEGVQDGIWVTDENDVIYFANKAMGTVSDMQLEDIIGHNVLTDFPVDNIAEFARDFDRAKVTLQPVWYEHRNVNSEGTVTYNNGWLIPRVQDGKYIGMICTVRDITLRKHMEAMLENEKKRFIALLEAFPGFMYLQAPDYRITYANKYFIEHFGDPQRFCYELMWGRTEPCEVCRTFNVFDTQEIEIWEWSNTPDGKDYLVYDHPFTDVDGSQLVLEIGIDISERKQAEELLKRSESNLNRAQQVAHLGSWAWHITSNQLEWSDEMYRIFGIEKEDFSGNLTDIVQTAIHPDDRGAVEQSNASVAQEGKPIPLEYRIIRPDGTVRTVWAEAGQLSLDAAGNPTMLTGIVQDITERKLAEQSLRDSETLYYSVVSALSEGLVVQDPTTDEVVFANDSAARILGLTVNQLLGKDSYDPRWKAMHEDGSPFLPEDHPSMVAARTGKPVDNILMNIYVGDEKWAYISINSHPVFDEQGHVVRVVTSFTDSTKRKNAENQLKRALADKETLLQELYHRTKNNMQTIMGLINLQASQVQNKQALEILEETENRVRSMALVHKKLYQSQNLSSIDLGDYIKELTTLLLGSYRITQEQIALVFDLDRIPVLIDTAIPCGLILNELVSNVFKHAFPNNEMGELRITLRQRDDDAILIEVADNGRGLPEGLNPRESNSLGMQTVYGIAEYQLKGRLDCESSAGVTWRLQFSDTLYQARV